MMTFVRRSLVAALLGGLALALSGCSSFDRDWKKARAAGVPSGDRLAGPWEGRWISARHGSPQNPAGGRLRCIFTRIDDTSYRAQFKANWMVFASSYDVAFRTARTGQTMRFDGEHDLGALFGGLYRYQGTVTPTRFVSSYDSSYDSGRFEMARPASGVGRVAP